MPGHIALKKHFVRNHSSPRFSFAKFRTRPRVAFYLVLRLLQLLPDIAFFATDIAEMALEKR
jgi:hypothetical protein